VLPQLGFCEVNWRIEPLDDVLANRRFDVSL